MSSWNISVFCILVVVCLSYCMLSAVSSLTLISFICHCSRVTKLVSPVGSNKVTEYNLIFQFSELRV